MPLHPLLFLLSFSLCSWRRVITFPLGVRCAWLQTCLVKNLPSVSIFLCETSYCWIMHETCSHSFLSLSLSFSSCWFEVAEATAQAEMVTPFPAAPASALINSTAHCWQNGLIWLLTPWHRWIIHLAAALLGRRRQVCIWQSVDSGLWDCAEVLHSQPVQEKGLQTAARPAEAQLW